MWVNLIIGLLIYLGFVLFRAKKGFEFYHARLLLPNVSRKPPQLRLHGHQRLWGWLLPVFKVSDEELVRSAGLDALIGVRIISFGVMLFLPMTIGSLAVLLPVNFTSDFYKQSAEQDHVMDEYTSVFMRMTISNISQGSPKLWIHFVFCYLNMGWACWLILEYYKEYIALRQTYLVRCTTVPGDARTIESGANSGTPLLTPSVGASRSPMKRGLAVAQPASPTKRGAGGGAGSGLLKAASGSGSLQQMSSLGRAMNRLKLPRRNASGAGDEFGEFAFRPSRFSSPSSSPPAGSPAHAPRDVVAAGSIFTFAGPSRFGHSRNPSKGSPEPSGGTPPAAVITADGSSAAVSGLAAALAVLPPGSPMRHGSATPSGGVELTDLGAGGSTGDWEQAADASGCSTPASGGPGRVRRPLLMEQALRSSDRLPPDSQEREAQRRCSEPQAAAAGQEASGHTVDRSLSFGSALRSLSLGHEPSSGGVSPQRQHHAGHSSVLEEAAATAHSRAHGSTSALLPLSHQGSGSLAVEPSGGSTGVLPLLGRFADSAAVGASGNGSLEEALPVGPRHGGTSSFEVAAALGYDQAPPHPKDIAAAMLAKGSARASERGAGAGQPPAGEATGEGGEGIATRWWREHQSQGVPRMLHLNQSITFKGAVRLAQRPGGSARALHASASLFTCLVMDMPLEKLKLRRIGVFPVMWRSIQLEPSSSLARGGMLSAIGGGGTPEPPNQEDISLALDELERGLPDTSRDNLDAHPSGLAGVVLRLRMLWQHRSRYAEWRRDVRWAMYNKRVRIATEMFSELFGSDFDSIIPIYPTASVDKLAHKWDAKLAVLERLQLALKETPRHKVKRVAKLKQRIAQLSKEVALLQSDIAAERDAVLSDLPSTCFFATFKSQQAAAIAAQTNRNPIMQRLFKVMPAPRPDDVNWPALQRSWWQRTIRPLYALPIILFFMLLPIGMFTGAFAQLTVALCGSPQDPGSRSDNWYCSDDRWATFTRNTLTSLVPSIVLSVYHMVFLPVMVYYAAQMEGQHVTLSALDRRCADLFFYWDVFNIFLGALFGGTVLAELKTFLSNPSAIWSALGSAIPGASNFFINYVMYRALVMCAFRLFYPHLAILPAILKWMRILPRARTQRDKLMEMPPRNCRFGRDIGIPVLMNFVMVCSMCVTSPLILPFGLLYFLGLWAVWRYQALYVYQRQYESGGQFWPLVAHKVVACQLIMVVFTASVLMFKGGYTQAALLYITGPIFLLRFDNYLTKRYDDLVRQVPLMAVHTAGRSSVPADIYTPPPLRAGGVGWHPECNYVMYRALVMCAFRLFYPHLAILPAILKWMRILPRARTQRDKLMEMPPRNCRFGRDIGIPVLMNFVMVCSMCVTSPLILPFGLLYFLGLWAVWRYQALYVYQRQYESGGQFWPLVAHKVVACQLIMVVFTASVLMFKGGYTQAALLYITGPIFLLRFDNYLTKRYDDLVRQVPLMAVHTAGRSSVPADIYTPPPLRAGGVGWHPECNYVMYRALVMCAFRLFYPHLAILPAILKWMRILPRARTQRDKLMEMPPRNCRFGRDIGIPVLMNFVMVCSMCVTSPLILPFGLLYFLGLWAVWRYQALYVYQRQYESGGQFWPLVAHKVVACQLIMVVFTASVLMFKGGYTQAALLYITGPIFLLRFDNYLTKRYDDLVRQVPLMAVHTAGRSSVPADIYTPPPLRAGGVGWHPEW
ncbi:ERD4-related membrane [Micractinium conductrix]|uniref:ERD4-related membrane n=1 Tax=Micractinium conductrix TaxID=554055 RepID=A0A2P6V5I2_9CHLO|nr:ERD4-related membrane [Micractinium conductrix]|eukprot:PSC69350.1 ERD4-related membrane [Micractinium conductrix]